MTISSNVPQPTSWAMLRTVGAYDSFAPNRPRSSTIAGWPVRVPGTAARPSISPPRIVPAAIATMPAMIEMVGRPPASGARTV
ncbi:hypothetical protein [Actinomadura madurae]|uniref:hypothetical protein n=1 Tax=Actinomadura madurae TaxID=1993 RepID=UPI0020D20FEE|nr:hypothetical protein [Actinomadura madurae]MCP9952056.1 hypothetical protein [Actinomadura madurae]MCP9981294.1 hypothetical protein [Actinomadura madurae]